MTLYSQCHFCSREIENKILYVITFNFVRIPIDYLYGIFTFSLYVFLEISAHTTMNYTIILYKVCPVYREENFCYCLKI